MYLIFLLNSLLYVQFCVPLFTIWRYNNNLFISLFLSHNYTLFFLHFYSLKQPLTTVQSLFTTAIFKLLVFSSQLVFTQGWLNFYYLSSALSCRFYSPTQKQSNEHSWSRTFTLSPSRELHCDHIVVCVLCTYCCRLCIVYTFLFLLSHTCLSVILLCLLLLVYL